MNNIIPREKLSKKQRRTLDLQQRATWGGINPVTRKPPNPKAYRRKKIQKGVDYDLRFESFLFFIELVPILPAESQPILYAHRSKWGV